MWYYTGSASHNIPEENVGVTSADVENDMRWWTNSDTTSRTQPLMGRFATLSSSLIRPWSKRWSHYERSLSMSVCYWYSETFVGCRSPRLSAVHDMMLLTSLSLVYHPIKTIFFHCRHLSSFRTVCLKNSFFFSQLISKNSLDSCCTTLCLKKHPRHFLL